MASTFLEQQILDLLVNSHIEDMSDDEEDLEGEYVRLRIKMLIKPLLSKDVSVTKINVHQFGLFLTKTNICGA